MKILLIGKTGQLGGDILRNNPGHDITAPDRADLDILSKVSIDDAMDRSRPDVVINTAAFHDVPLCESEPKNAFLVNCVAVRDIARACLRTSALFVTFSSDYVFDGMKSSPYREEDRPAPLQIYGITRLAGEYAALSAAPQHTMIIRTCGLFGISGGRSRGGNFVDKRIHDARSLSSLEISSDQIVSPTSTHDLSEAVLRLIAHPQKQAGIYHLVNEGNCSWSDFTKSIYDILGLPVRVIPIDRQGMSGSMRRPRYSVLANTKARALGIILPHWRDALERYIRTKHSTAKDARRAD